LTEMQKYKAVVIGSSAGGLFALGAILEKLPANYPLAVIVVQHRSRDANVLFEEMLQQKCKIKVKQADEKEKIAPGTVYIAPPNYHLLVELNETFSLSAGETVKYSRPSIDILFETAAEAFGSNLIGIIMTGSNSDGANGLQAISRFGGITIAQDPEEAQYAAMPLAAIEIGAAKKVMKLHDIAGFLTGEALA
jgi:two-component system chemotaxis response regulator CheB